MSGGWRHSAAVGCTQQQLHGVPHTRPASTTSCSNTPTALFGALPSLVKNSENIQIIVSVVGVAQAAPLSSDASEFFCECERVSSLQVDQELSIMESCRAEVCNTLLPTDMGSESLLWALTHCCVLSLIAVGSDSLLWALTHCCGL